ncbi:MAG: tetratricopeptide repeat protein [Chloroflexi bacterium]|nr:tetratricopeptide repeat protein [Chloroflexota bacterium]
MSAPERSEPGNLEEVAKALSNRGIVLGKLGRHEEEVATYGDVAERFGGRREPGILELVARALVNRGIVLGHLGRVEEAIATYGDVVERFGGRREPTIVAIVSVARDLRPRLSGD